MAGDALIQLVDDQFQPIGESFKTDVDQAKDLPDSVMIRLQCTPEQRDAINALDSWRLRAGARAPIIGEVWHRQGTFRDDDADDHLHQRRDVAYIKVTGRGEQIARWLILGERPPWA